MAADTLKLALKGVARWAGSDTGRTLKAMLLWSGNKVRLTKWSRTRCWAVVKSEEDPETRYRVTYDRENGWTCECMDHQAHGATCKHIRAVSWTWGSVRRGVQVDE